MWAISASASRSCQLPIAAREAAYSFCVFARPFFVFVTGIITARGLLLRTSARGALVVATSSAKRTNSGRLLISIGVGCLRITALYQSDLKLISCNLNKKIFNRNLKHQIYSAFQEVKQVVLPLYRLKHQITYSMRDNKIV